MKHFLELKGVLPVKALNAGYFMSRGIGKHADRTMNTFEIIYVSSGTLGIFEDDVEYNVKEGQAIILFPHRHHGGTRQFDKNLNFYWIHFLIDEKADTLGDNIMSLPQLIDLAKPEQFVELFRRFIKIQSQYSDSQIMLNLVLLELLCELSNSTYPLEVPSQQVLLANRAKQYIRLHLDEKITTSTIADALKSNPDYLGRIFKQVFRKTLTEFIQEHRLYKASKMLIESTHNINEIAYSCGYTDVDYFRKNFKKQYGISPNEYRKTYEVIATSVEL
jgi:Response regulator containing CheY-like receiver domain and AraC-type DNA-binding domain